MTTPSPEVPIAQDTLFGGAPKPVGNIYSSEQIVDTAFAYWRERGFPYRNLTVHECMDEVNRLALLEDVNLMGTPAGYHVADTYHRHRFASAAAGMRSPLAAFGDDKLLRRALGQLVEYGQPLTAAGLNAKLAIVSGTQACSNFRPGFALAMYRRFCRPGATVLDTSSGYGGRLVGWMASGLGGRYIGIDPSSESCVGNRRMAMALGFSSVTQINLPAEDVDWTALIEAFGAADFAFTSPPYFTKERYATGHADEELQSWARYPTGDTWRRGFLEPLMRLQFAVLAPGAVSVMNVQDVTLDGKVYPLTDWLLDAAAAVGFEQESHDVQLQLQRRFGAGQASIAASEPIYVFRKP